MKGFTLIEFLITITIFAIVVTGLLSLFGSGLSLEKQSLNISYLLDSSSYLAEYISRSLRMAQKELNCFNPSSPETCDPLNPSFCLTSSGYGYNYEIYDGGRRIRFINHQGECQEFFLESDMVKIKRTGIIGALTPSNIIVEDLHFQITGEGQTDLEQPKVTFALRLKTQEKPVQKLNIQTTVSQRQLDIVY